MFNVDKELNKALDQDILGLSNDNWKSLLDAIDYLRSTNTSPKNKRIIMMDLIELSSLAEERGEDLSGMIEGSIYEYVDRSRSALGDDQLKSKILNIFLNILTNLNIVLVINLIIAFISGSIVKENIYLDFEGLVNPFLIISLIRIYEPFSKNLKQKGRRILSFIIYIILSFIIALVFYGILDYLGIYREDIVVNFYNYLIIIFLSIASSFGLSRYINMNL